MARKVDIDDRLLKAGLEGFSSLKERRNKRPPQETQINSPNINQQSQVPTINSKEAARRYGGKLIEPVITSDKAALRYGGIAIGSAITSDKAVKRYGGVLIQEKV